MKKTLIGIGLILFAGYILFGESLNLPSIDLPIWTLVMVVLSGIGAFQNLFKKDYMGSYACAVIAFMFLENHYNWLAVGTGTLILAAIIAGIGLSMLIQPTFIHINYHKSKTGKEDGLVDEDGTNTAFGNKTRYINDDALVSVGGDVAFASASLYFDNAVILGDKATYSGDAAFSTVKLYVPKHWAVEFVGSKVFSTIAMGNSGVPKEKTLVVTGDYAFSRLEVIYI